MSPVDRAGSLTGTNTWGSYEKFQPGFRDEKRPKTSCGSKSRNKANIAKREATTFAPITALATLHSRISVVKWRLKWDAYDVENTAGKAIRCRIHTKNSSRVTEETAVDRQWTLRGLTETRCLTLDKTGETRLKWHLGCRDSRHFSVESGSNH